MHAAVVRSLDHPPRYEEFPDPEPSGPDEALVQVLAAGLHPRVRSGASGSHYSSRGMLPLIPGVDGVGRLPDGELVYFVSPDDTWGSMAERARVDLRRTVPLPEGVDPLRVAAAMNPAMSSWVALRCRVPIRAGQSVLILGATGNAGTMAVEVAKRLGASRVVGAGRNAERLGLLGAVGADEVIALTGNSEETGERLAHAAAEVDIVVDYLWGEYATLAMTSIVRARAERSRALDWIQIGAIAGRTIELPSEVLRAANLRIQGSGQGSVSTHDYVAELPALVEEIEAGRLTVNVSPADLADVESVWVTSAHAGERTVFVP